MIPDPSIFVFDESPEDGEIVWAWTGMFIARFSPEGSTQLIATPDVDESDLLSAYFPEVNEVVLRASLGGELAVDADGEQIPGVLVMTSPHFVVDTGVGQTAYHDQNTTLRINGEEGYFANFEYVIFVPASVVGQAFNYFVHGEKTVFNPVLGDEMEGDPEGSMYFVNDPSTWTLNPDWITNEEGNAGLFEMIDLIAGVGDPAERLDNEQWVSVANYFQRFFAKFYRAMCTMFNIGNGLGNGGNSSFQLIALDDSAGPMQLEEGAVLSVEYAPSNAEFVLNGDVLELTADPPLEFRTAVVQQN